MNLTATDIERVVREVLAELAAVPRPVASASQSVQQGLGTSVPSASPNGSASATTDPGTLAINSRVVTMQEIAGRLNGARLLVVPREAIITPAVEDELLRRGVSISRGESAAVAPAPVRLVMFTMGTDFDPAALAACMTREGCSVEHSDWDCLIAATDALAEELVKPNTLGVLLTRHTAAGLCLANRLKPIRAVGGVDAPSVAAAAAAVGANLLVVDPRAGTFFQLKQMVGEFCRAGVRPCPAIFRNRL